MIHNNPPWSFRLAFEKAFEDIADSSWLAKLTDWLLEPFSFFFEATASNIVPSVRLSVL